MKRIFFFLLVLGTTVSGIAEENVNWTTVRHFFKKHNTQKLVYIRKSSFELFIIDRSLKILDKTKISYGSNSDKKPKLYKGDKRTPEGLYKIIEVLRMNMNKNSWQYKKLKRMNSVFFYAKYGHSKWNKPNDDLGTNAYGVAFFRLNYPNLYDKKRYIRTLNKDLIPKNKKGKYLSFGGGIAIHGTDDPESIEHLSSSGCIRVLNSELKRISHFLTYGTYVYIEY